MIYFPRGFASSRAHQYLIEQDRPRGIRLASDSYVSRWMNYYRKHRVRMDAEITHIVAEKTAAPSSHSATCVAGSSNTLVARIPNPTSRAATLLEPSHVSRTLASTHLADIRSHPAGDTDWVTSSNEGRGVKAESAQDAASVRAIQPLAEEVSSGNPRGKKLRIRGSCFTEKEDALLAAYIASVLPNPRDRGRTGPRLYMALVERVSASLKCDCRLSYVGPLLRHRLKRRKRSTAGRQRVHRAPGSPDMHDIECLSTRGSLPLLRNQR